MAMQPFAALGGIISSLMGSMYSMILIAGQYVGLWFTFRKMGLPGWKGIIPFYNYYVICEKVWDTKQFWRLVIYTCVGAGSAMFGGLFMGLGGIGTVFSAYYNQSASPAGIIFIVLGASLVIASLVMAILLLVLQFRIYVRLTQAFRLKRAWAWGLLFVPFVMFPLIGLHKNIFYYGPQQYYAPQQPYGPTNQPY